MMSLAILVAASWLSFTDATLHQAVILPHGDEAADARLVPAYAREAAKAIAAGAAAIAGRIDPAHNILLSSPHGIFVSTDYGLYLGNMGSGSVVLGGG